MNEVFKEAVELDKSGYIQTEDGVHTSAEKVYVAGDARAKELKQLVTAMSDGAIAATAAVQEIYCNAYIYLACVPCIYTIFYKNIISQTTQFVNYTF